MTTWNVEEVEVQVQWYGKEGEVGAEGEGAPRGRGTRGLFLLAGAYGPRQ